MRILSLLFFSFFFTLTFGQVKDNSIGFIENKGQIVDQKGKPNTSVKYLLNTNGLNVQLREKGFSYDVYESKKHPKKVIKETNSFVNLVNINQEPEFEIEYKFHRIDFAFLNANASAKLIPEEKSTDYDNYYNVIHAPEGITNVHKYKRVTYKNIYNNIDAVFFIPSDSTKVVEYNFIIKPGGKISDIQLKIEGGKTDLIDNKIRMNLRFGQMEETIPMSWTEKGNDKSEIKVNYKKIKKNVYGFEGDFNSSNETIVIDPVPIRLWGTYYGGSNTLGKSLTSDYLNFIYFSGETKSSNNIATAGSFQNQIQGQTDGFIFKFSPQGIRIWGTYLGGEYHDYIMTSDINDNHLVVGGITQSYYNIATLGTHNQIYNPGNGVDTGSGSSKNDCFINKFDLNGFRIWGTYYGGESNEYPLDLAIDKNDNVIIVGVTYSIQGISTSGSFKETRTQPVNPNTVGEGYIAKFNSNGNLIWGTYYGLNEVRAVDTDSNLNIFISGDTDGNGYISTQGTHQFNLSYNISTGVRYKDSFIGKFDTNGNRIWGTYYGGYGYEFNNDLKIDSEDNIYISGYTYSNNFISTPNSHQENFGGGVNDSYLAKFNQNGLIIWGTYYGGSNLENRKSNISINNNNEIYLSGSTWSTNNISTIGSYSEFLNSTADVFISKFNKNGLRIWGTYFGGNSTDYCEGINVDKIGGINIYGYSYSTNGISTQNSFQEFPNSSPGRFLVRFLDCQSSTFALSNSPVCIGNNLELTANGGTTYSWTGPNGFTSSEQNPIILNANTIHSGQYSCAITGTSNGCDNTVTLNVVVGDFEAPIPTISNLPLITGDCNTIISTIPTAIDNCSGTIIGTTTNPLSYTNPGNYTITWNYDDGNGNSSSQTQNVTISSVALPSYTSPQQFCIQQNATLNDIVITGQNITWYNALTDGTVLPTNTLLLDGVTYYASQTINGCESARVPVLVNIQNTPAPTGNQNQSFCSAENATLNSIAITGTDIIWYDSLTGNTILPTSTLLQNGVTYYASQTINGCESPARLAISMQLINTLNAINYSETICDDLNNGIETVNLSNYNSFLISSTGNVFKYYYSLNGAQNQLVSDEVQNSSNYNLSIGNNLFYVRIESPNTCFQIVTLELQLVSKPFLNINDIMPICEGETITINAGNGFDTYLWSTNEVSSSITISQSGNHSVTVSKNHGTTTCSSTKNFTVINSNIGTISEIITSDWTQNENTISVLLGSNSFGNYEYSLNGIDFQDNNTFYGLENGEYTVYVRDKNGCGISSEDIYLLMYPKFFTPNGDGYNDFWKIKFSENEPNLKVKIFDRYGKFLFEFYPNSMGWDGKFNNIDSPSTDYWFVVIRENGKEYKGHFSLIR
ncbi:DUF7948 domain-containing protein [Flavobacterium tibetense]|uniref:Ig-like domain-containing protein n=1 Tax=Flavobacterium tibetense TaxID=2233533 RepID=A0A365P2U8_9FLAO|nr:T9SS type B sorting domain-containing protein [Flavobacterium tibetense]RBA28828.1 hypothetical protein DPN68_05410 [Flavobacterium tibetense]